MGIANKLNSGRRDTVREGVDTKNITYMSAADFADTMPVYPIPLAGFFIKDGDYGKQVTLIIDTGVYQGLNIPKRYADMFEELTPDEIEAVKTGDLLIKNITPDVNTPKGKTTMIDFVDRDDLE